MNRDRCGVCGNYLCGRCKLDDVIVKVDDTCSSFKKKNYYGG